MNQSIIILLASQAVSNREIAERLSIHYKTVSLWRRRFIEYTSLHSFIEADLPEDLKELVETILMDKYRSGASWTYGNDVRAKIKLIACQDQKAYGYTLCHWNLLYLRIVLIETGVVESISIGALYHILKTDEIRPWKIRYWLHSKEKYENHETYSAKIQAVNQIEIWFGIINKQLLKRKSFIIVEKLEQCIRDYIVQYNKYLAPPFKWTYNDVPETKIENPA